MSAAAQPASRRYAAAKLFSAVLAAAAVGHAVAPTLASADSLAAVDPADGRTGADVEQPAIPLSEWQKAVRFRLFTTFTPQADIGGAEVSLVRPGGRIRARVPLNHRVQLQFTASYARSFYDVNDDASIFDECDGCAVPGTFNEALLALEAGFLLNEDRHLIRPGERWAVLTGGFGRARWESGAFQESITGGGSFGLGYDLPDRLRLALGVNVESSIIDAGASVGPLISFRWDLSDQVHLRDRGMGLQLGVEPADNLEVFIAGFRSSDRFRVNDRDNAPSDMTFRDRQLLVSAGAEWKIVRELRLTAEAGAIIERKVTMKSDDDTLDTAHQKDTSPYVGIRVEIRP